MSLLKDSFKSVGNWGQLFTLLLFSFLGLIIGGIATTIITLAVAGGKAQSIITMSYGIIQLIQVISVLFMFFLPTIAFSYLFKDTPTKYMKLSVPHSWLYLLLSIMLVVSIQPLINFIGFYNEQLTLPDSMGIIERIFRSMADNNAALMAKLLANNSFVGIIINLFVIAFVAALVEECFFRGCLQQILVKIAGNIHVGIWLTAIIFSLIHFDIYGFFPRVLLGAILGYIFVWTQNLWYSFLVHFLNNAAVVILQLFYYKSAKIQSSTFEMKSDMPYLIVGTIVLVITIYFFNKYKTTILKQNEESGLN